MVEKIINLEKLLRVTVYVVRFVNNLKTAVHKTEIVKEEIVFEDLMSSEKLWVKYEQAILKRASKLENSLALFYDEENLLRSKPRIDQHLQINLQTKSTLL